jgi:hypothetical protein
MICKGHVQNGVVVLEPPASLPEGAEVRVEVGAPERSERTLGERLMKYAGVCKGLPSDLARNHDHYLYGVPKK